MYHLAMRSHILEKKLNFLILKLNALPNELKFTTKIVNLSKNFDYFISKMWSFLELAHMLEQQSSQ